MELGIDDGELEDHVPRAEDRGGPCTPIVAEWDASDVFRAADHGIVDPDESTLVSSEKIA